jgi:scyllo-inositol 2-dehydrogenase (NADP+)
MKQRKGDTTMNLIKVAIIGYGMSGQLFHLPPLLKNSSYKVSMIMTQNSSRIAQIQSIDKDIKIISSFDLAIGDPNIDLIVIATSNDVHYEYTKKALLHQKHVVCEKPFVASSVEAKELFELARKNNLILSVYHNRKYDGDIMTIKEMIQNQRLGKIISFSARFDRFIHQLADNWRYEKTTMAGIYYDLAPHLVHHAISIFGKPERVYLNLFHDHEQILVDDHFEMTLYYKDLTCFLGAATLERHPKPRFEVIGDIGTYVKYGYDHPDVNYDKSITTYLSNVEKSIIIKDDVERVPIKMGQHYQYYDQLALEINQKARLNIEEHIQLMVIHVMEKGIESNSKKAQVLI